MKTRTALLFGVGFLLGACATTLDEVRTEPVRWSGDYARSHDALANCISAQATGPYIVSTQIYRREGYSQVILANPTTSSVMQEFTIRRLSDSSSQVEWRRKKLVADLGGLERIAQENTARCSKM